MVNDKAIDLLANDPASQMLGIKLVKLSRDHCQLHMLVTEKMTNGYQVCHGGFIFSLADTACAFSAAEKDRVVLSSASQIEYLAPALLGDVLNAEAQVVKRVGKAVFCDVEVWANNLQTNNAQRVNSQQDKNSVLEKNNHRTIALLRGKLVSKPEK